MPASDRTLDCPHFGTCGGCSALHEPIAAQRRRKIDAVRATLGEHVAGLSIRFTDEPARPPRFDRMRALYPVQPDDAAGPTMGIYRRGTHSVVELQSCEIQHPALTELGRRALAIFRRRDLTPYDETRHQGLLRAFSARLSATTGDLLVGLVTTSDALPDAGSLAAELLEATRDLPLDAARDAGLRIRGRGVVLNVNERRGNALLGPDTRVLAGADHVVEVHGDLGFRIGFTSFYQSHRDSDTLLFRPAMEMLGPLSGLRVVDAFGGVGTFAVRAAARGAEHVTLVESHAPACSDARHNASRNGLPGIEVVEASFAGSGVQSTPDLLVVDPNRAGLQARGCAEVERLGAPRVLYVACGLPALGRDLARLPSYRVVDLHLADLFPHTDHVETIALLAYSEYRRHA